MKHIRYIAVTVLTVVFVWQTRVSAQSAAVPTPEGVAKALGLTDAEVVRIKGGEIIRKDLKEGSDKELAGVVAVLLNKPVSELVEVAMQGKLLEKSSGMLALNGWDPDESADEAFANLGLSPSETGEAKIFAEASPGSKLNLSTAEIALFQKVQPTPDSVNPQLRAMLKARYEAYRKSGLNGIAPYTRGGRNESHPGKELELAINETKAAARNQNYFNALLSYPSNPLPDMKHRFYWFKQTVEGRPTFILAHRAERQVANAALLTEEQFYVGHSYNSNFIAGGCLEVQGGTLVFYVNRTFTDQVAGWGSGMKHSIGRGQMLDEVATNLKRIREQLQK
jgi:hypothetical protein